MMLNLYYLNEETNEFLPYSNLPQNDTPIHSVLNGADGGVQIFKVYLKNGGTGASNYYYKGIRVQPMPQSIVEENNPRKLTFKILSGSRQPTDAEWSKRTTGAAIYSDPGYASDPNVSPKNYYLPEIGSLAEADLNYHPIWVRIELPPKTPPLVELGIRMELEFEEYAR